VIGLYRDDVVAGKNYFTVEERLPKAASVAGSSQSSAITPTRAMATAPG